MLGRPAVSVHVDVEGESHSSSAVVRSLPTATRRWRRTGRRAEGGLGGADQADVAGLGRRRRRRRDRAGQAGRQRSPGRARRQRRRRPPRRGSAGEAAPIRGPLRSRSRAPRPVPWPERNDRVNRAAVRRATGTVVGDDREHRSTPTSESHDAVIAEALRVIDQALGRVSGRELVSSGEVADLLLDVRTLLTPSPPNRSEHVHSRSRSIPVPVEELFAWHERDGALDRLLPPWKRYRVIERHGTIHERDRVRLRIDAAGVSPLGRRAHRLPRHESSSIARQRPGAPLGTHPPIPRRRTVRQRDRGHSRLRGPVGPARQLVVRRHLRGCSLPPSPHAERPGAAVTAPRPSSMRIAVTGSSGVVGRDLVPFLTTAGHQVDRLCAGGPVPADLLGSRRRLSTPSGWTASTPSSTSPARVRPPWTRSRRRRIRGSRINGTRLLSETLAGSAAAARARVGLGRRLLRRSRRPVVDETCRREKVLATMCAGWEGPRDRIVRKPCRQVRNGVVFSARGGALPTWVRPFRLGLGGRIGSGEQYVS